MDEAGRCLFRAYPAARRDAPAASLNAKPLPPLGGGGLFLPRLADSVPGKVVLQPGSDFAIRFAEELLDLGVLLEDDWAGDLAGSVRAGLSRWINERERAGGINNFNLYFLYGDDAEDALRQYFCWVEEWGEPLDQMEFLSFLSSEKMGGSLGEPTGFFGIAAIHCWETFVGPRILQLERIRKGAGYSVLATLDRTIANTVEGATPTWVENELAEWHGDHCECVAGEGDAPCDCPTLENYYRQVPKEVFKGEINRRAMLEARRRTDDWSAVGVLDAALVLEKRMRAYSENLDGGPLNHLFHIQPYCHHHALPVSVRWNDEDITGQIVDQHHDDMQMSGEGTDLCYFRAFQLHADPSAPASLASAAKALSETLELLRLTDGILNRLDSEETFGRRDLVSLVRSLEAPTLEAQERARVRA